MAKLKQKLVGTVYPFYRVVARPIVIAARYGGDARECPVCERSFGRFRPRSGVGEFDRPDAICPNCLSKERDRQVILFLRERTALFTGGVRSMLHVAPEPVLGELFSKAVGSGYLSVDLQRRNVMERMDITAIPKPDESYDAVYCSHVLEHVPDDRLAMRELHRVLKPGGWAVLNVPVTVEATFEDPSITDPEERHRAYGQHDHVRAYGPDYADRLREAGFAVEVYAARDHLPADLVDRYGLANELTGDVYFCTK